MRDLDQQLDEAVHDFALTWHAVEGQQRQADTLRVPADLPCSLDPSTPTKACDLVQVEAAQDIAWELEPAKKIELGDLSKQAFEADPAPIGSEVSERRASAFIGQKCIQPLARS